MNASDDVIIKALFGLFITIIYVTTVLTQPLTVAYLSTFVSAVTNAIVGFFSYNMHKRAVKKLKGEDDGQGEVKENY